MIIVIDKQWRKKKNRSKGGNRVDLHFSISFQEKCYSKHPSEIDITGRRCMGHGIRVDFNEEKGFLTNTDEIKDISTSCGRTQVIDWHREGRWWWCRYNNWNNLRQQLILNFISIGRSVRI